MRDRGTRNAFPGWLTGAALQVEARRAPESSPPFRLIDPGDDLIWGHGLEQLPQPLTDSDVFLDF